MPNIKWSNYVIASTFLGNQIVIGKVGKNRGIFMDKSPDMTKEAVGAVYAHMKTEYEQKKMDDDEIVNLEFTFQDGSKLTYSPPLEAESK